MAYSGTAVRTMRTMEAKQCAICERTLLVGELLLRFAVDGISRSLGEPKASIVVLPGQNAEVVITVAWEISWYQYRVSPGSPQPVRLAERGLEPGELDSKFSEWNAGYESGTGILPDIDS